MDEPRPGPTVWLHPALRVSASPVAGRGLFTDALLVAGTVVVRLAADADARVDRWGTDFPNHCCDPNAGWVAEQALATMTDVPAGAELLTDYAMSICQAGWLLRCHCPSYRCRQMVEGSDWQIPQLQTRYAGWWRPSVQELVTDASAG